ncbi:N-acetylmuramoyl-L-alanine amidase [Sodalis glossinidius str. 'morsitans']|uniref:N-acetylmuramoyl-L-alanine amidase n=1 Tax=Sodalis glossinidius (strain morsitans) TaxID=343509 RepID=A0A193QHI5_SODGM|nr:N-acetylmuramoyl-L-alanine amidase [Sodalis glossinidius]CRL44642.1 N-acetylmuramoyl-L-alanine amidase [Sodalis glossinidius str. 'morsitans']
MSRVIHRIIIHCAATPNGSVLGRCGETAAPVIDRWHRARGFQRDAPANDNGLTSIGYHGVIDADGQLLTGRGAEEVGAHVCGYNADSLGLCLWEPTSLLRRSGPCCAPGIDAACVFARC